MYGISIIKVSFEPRNMYKDYYLKVENLNFEQFPFKLKQEWQDP